VRESLVITLVYLGGRGDDNFGFHLAHDSQINEVANLNGP
jgi:hypothetical protein